VQEGGELPCNVGDIIAGKYRVEGVLGRGGMATVFSAWHEELEQRVALKMLHAGMSSDPMHAKRFIREARNAARIQSEHIARIMDVGRTDGDRVYIVMEYLEGNDLSRVLKLRGPLPVDEVIEYLVQACDAIAVAHSLGIVHRDLKPANLFLTRTVDGATTVKVLDFGIAKAFDQPAANELTTTTAIVGSPLYMAPEQMANARDVDRRADLWSLGVIAYRLLTKSLPFRGENLVELAMAVASTQPKPLRDHRPEISPALADAIMRCLERDPEKRWPDVASFVHSIAPYGPARLIPTVQRITRVARGPQEPLAEGAPSGSHDVMVFDQTSNASSTTLSGPLAPPSATSVAPELEPARSRRGPVIAISIVLIAIGVGAGVLFANVRSNKEVVSDPPAAAAAPKPSATVSAEPTVETLTMESAVPSVSAKPLPPPTAKVMQKPVAGKPTASAKPKDVWGWGE
jgi:eukaryotic-like serine/threonine-protein kinase